MKTIFSLAILVVAALSFSTAQATAPSPDISAVAPYIWDFDCAKIDCPLSGTSTFTQSFWAHDCDSVPEERIKEAAQEIANRFCEQFKRCCIENGCDEGSCRLVDYTWACRSTNKLVIKVKIEYKCG